MQINNTPNFKANLVASSGKLKLYKLNGQADIKALNKLCAETDFSKLMPNQTKQEAERWHEMLEYATDNAQKNGNITYIESFQDKICGIITYNPAVTSVIDCICTIPVKAGEKVKLAGKTLFYQVFKDFLEYNGSRINLSAITNGPFNTINKYKELGFKETSSSTPTYVEMTVNKYKVKEAFEMLKKLIPYKREKETSVDLMKELS